MLVKEKRDKGRGLQYDGFERINAVDTVFGIGGTVRKGGAGQ